MTGSKHIAGVDSLRGLMLLLMVAAHLCYDLTAFGWFPGELYFSAPIQALITLGAAVFILISGAMARFSRSNVRRGIKYLTAGLLITAVTLLFPHYGIVRFGILHLLGVSALFYAAFGRHLERLSLQSRVMLYALLAFGSAALTALPVDFPGAWLLGFTVNAPPMADWFAIFPWLFVYLLGTVWGECLFTGRIPAWFAGWHTLLFVRTSRYALWVYLLHQPVILGILWCVQLLIVR